MVILDVFSGCSSPSLAATLLIIKKIMSLIQIVVPILLIMSLIFTFIKLMADPDNKKLPPRIKNSIIATVIVFMIPVFVNAVMGMLGENFSVSACWSSIRETSGSSTYINPNKEKKKQSIIPNPSDYEKGTPRKQGTALDVESGLEKYSTGNLKYYVYIPPKATTNMPMLIWLHGDGASSNSIKKNRIGETAYQTGIPTIVVFPYAPDMGSSSNPGWYEGGLLSEVKTIADTVCDAYHCDTDNINIGGHSRGAIGTWMMVSSYPGYFHAASPVSCCSFYGMRASSFSGMKVWAWRGSGKGSGDNNDDAYGNCMQSDVSAVKGYAKEVRYTIQPNTTHGEAMNKLQTSEEFIKFMFSD